MLLYGDYRAAKLAAGGGGAKDVNERFKSESPQFFPLIEGRRGRDAKSIGRALRNLYNQRQTLRREMRSEQIASSFFGKVGRALEPITRYAGFDWKVNIALISSFAARESSVATLGAIYQEGSEEGATLETRMNTAGQSEGRTPLGALAILVFFRPLSPMSGHDHHGKGPDRIL